MVDLKKWDCGVPGKENTIWAGGLFKLDVTFPDGRFCASMSRLLEKVLMKWTEYPTKPPKCEFALTAI